MEARWAYRPAVPVPEVVSLQVWQVHQWILRAWMTTVATDPIDQLAAHCRYRLGIVVTYAHPWRVDELVGLSLKFWPHRHLEAVLASGRNHAAVRHAMTLLKARVRETWEADHGIGPMWDLVLDQAVDGISTSLLDLWWSGDRWRCEMRSMARRLSR
jgi:hypothetical protein